MRTTSSARLNHNLHAALDDPPHGRPIRTPALPGAALALAGLWCLAQAVDAPQIAAAVAVATLAAASATSGLRRGSRRLRFAVLLPALLLGAGLVAVFSAPADSAVALAVQLAILIVLAPLAPVLYAATFDSQPGDDP
jgi:uncharacterized membrane protein HdeD (DUF308 family)